ncbi:MAG TPA: hypothetical protein VGV12_04880 [Gemmatimonadales bacterium]|nr:hypothetical protein [Gemmatimonadales bacterium]
MAKGTAVAEVASRPTPSRDVMDYDVAQALRTWGVTADDRSLWVVCRPESSRWHVARVRSDLPAPPPAGVERRSPDRLILELAGLSLGALERIWTAADQGTVYLVGALSLIETCVERVRGMRGLTTTDRAHLLADLAVVADSIQGAADAA